MVFLTSDLLMRELFGDLMEEQQVQDAEKKHIKESKARKAMLIFEAYAQYIDFEETGLHLLAPINKTLEGSPGFS